MDFTLEPFRENEFIKLLDGEIVVRPGEVRCDYHLVGDINSIVWPALEQRFERRTDLWKHTCFEFFLGKQDEPGYFEFNLSPTGDWNSYAFSSFRKDMKPTDRFVLQNMEVTANTSQRRLSAVVDLVTELQGTLVIGVAAVIEDVNGWHHYYALAHSGERPDFHRRDTHLIRCEL